MSEENYVITTKNQDQHFVNGDLEAARAQLEANKQGDDINGILVSDIKTIEPVSV
jgi:hypothetical protein